MYLKNIQFHYKQNSWKISNFSNIQIQILGDKQSNRGPHLGGLHAGPGKNVAQACSQARMFAHLASDR